MSTLDHQPGSQAVPRTSYAIKSFGRLAGILVVGIIASTLPQPQALGKLPLQNILKNQLHVKPSTMASFFLYCGLFWYIKPLAGILTDSFPLFGTRRRYYILFSAVLAAAAWTVVGFVPHTYNSLLVAAIVVNLFMVMISTTIGAFLVEVGQGRGQVGRITAVRQVTYNACSLVQGPLGGLFATLPFMLAAGVNAGIVFSIFPVAFFLLREKPEAARNPHARTNARKQLGVMGRSGTFWASLTLIALFHFAPGFTTLLYYRQNDMLRLSQQAIGWLTALGGLGGVLAALAYGFLARRVALRTALSFGIITSAAGTMLYLLYTSLALARVIDFQNGLFFGFAEVALIDLAARATPPGCEGLGYSLMLSVRNLTLFGADKLGAYLSDTYHLSWRTMVITNAATTAIVLVILPFMPATIMLSRDQQAPKH
ncbi:MAG TPA: MFS transporter [Tepidisphaeraceae bacterium]|nr:MFS transporter [Tepidisphaeraceae bacterium]